MPRGRKSNRKASYIIDMTDRRQTGFIFIESCQSYLFCELERERDREREREIERERERKKMTGMPRATRSPGKRPHF
jgi:hypothetical protein